MKIIIVLLFVLPSGELGNFYVGKAKSDAECVATAKEVAPKALPTVKQGVIMCVRLPEEV